MPACRQAFVTFVLLALLACGGGDGNGDTSPGSVTLAVAVTGPGAVEVSGVVSGTCDTSCDFSVTQGAELTLSPAPAEGAQFDGFGGACSGTETCALRLAADTSITATFSAKPVEPKIVELAIARTGDGAGQVTSEPPGVTCTTMGCSGSFEAGTLVTLAAVPDAGSLFVGWEGGACSGAGACELTLSSAMAVTCRFERDHLPDRYVVTEITYADEDVRVQALDEDGNAVGCVGGTEVGSLSRPFLYDASTGAVVLLPPEDRGACAIGLGGGTIAIQGEQSAYRFAGGTLDHLGSLGGDSVMASDVNDSGWIVGTATLPDGRPHPFLHDGVTMHDLGTAVADVSVYAEAINSSGEVLASDGRLFSEGGWRTLSLPAGGYVRDLSDGGLVVGGVDLGGKAADGLVHDARTGLTTRVDPPNGMLFLSFYRANASGTRRLAGMGGSSNDARHFVYGAETFQGLAELLGRPERYTSGEDVNNRGQIAVRVVDYEDARARVRSFILTPE